MWEKMSEKLNLWKDEEIYKGKNHVMIYGNHSMLNASLYYKYMHIPTKVWEQNYGQQEFFVGFALARFSTSWSLLGPGVEVSLAADIMKGIKNFNGKCN